MTYRSRGRSIFEMAIAVTFVGFLAGFVTVLCIGNYFRAKNAMERQRERRLARLTGRNNVRPNSSVSKYDDNPEHQGLLAGNKMHRRHPNNDGHQNANGYRDNMQSETSDNNAYRMQQTGLQKRNTQNNHNREEDLIMLKENEEDDNEAAFMTV